MLISSLRNLVNNGWTIANRKALTDIIGQEECQRLCKAVKEGATSKGFTNNSSQYSCTLPFDTVSLSCQNKQVQMSLATKADGNASLPNALTFTDKEINLKNILEQLSTFEKKVASKLKINKELPASSLESKTLKKLYSAEFKVPQGKNEDGYFVTTIINKQTGKPEKAYVKRIYKGKDGGEGWKLYVKDADNNYKLVGIRSFVVDNEHKRIAPGWMDSEGGSEKYAGIGLRAHQISIERMIEEGLDTVNVSALPKAFPFHYKTGFRAVQKETQMSASKLEALIEDWSKNSGIDIKTLRDNVVSRSGENDTVWLNNLTMENFRKLLFLKNNGKEVMGNTEMELRGEWLEKWKEMVYSQPIILSR